MFSGNEPSPFIVFRSIGVPDGERFGVGIMDKTGISEDYVNRAHPGYVIVLLLRGSGAYRTAGGETFALEPGSVFQRFRGVPHTSLVDPDSHYLECFIELGESVAALLERYGISNRETPVLKANPTPLLVEKFVQLGECFRNEPDAVLIKRIPEMLELAQLCLAGAEEPEQRARCREVVAAACVFLGRDFSRPADLREFCRRHGYGYENFRKLFKAELGISPHRYRVRRRLDAACALLSRPELPVTEIAELLGYSSPYEFSAQFKRYFGYPPSEYRP